MTQIIFSTSKTIYLLQKFLILTKHLFSCKPVKKKRQRGILRNGIHTTEHFTMENMLFLGKIRLLFYFIIKCIYIPAQNIPGTSLLTITVRTFLSDFKASTAFEN